MPTEMLAGLDAHAAGHERDEVGRERLRFRKADANPVADGNPFSLGAVRNRLPRRRMLERDGPATFQVGLIEAGQGLTRTRGHEQRVEQIGAAVQRRLAGAKAHLHDVLARLQVARRDDEVTVDRFDRDGRAVGDDRDVGRVLRCEVDHQRTGGILQTEAQHVGAGHRSVERIGDRQVQVVA
jgi:hypothetical protein